MKNSFGKKKRTQNQCKYLNTSQRIKLHLSKRQGWGEVFPSCNTNLQRLFLAAYVIPSDGWDSSFHSLVEIKIWEKTRVCLNLATIYVWKSWFQVMAEEIGFCSQTIARQWRGFIYYCCYCLLISQENKNTISSAFIFNIFEMLFLQLFCGVREKRGKEWEWLQRKEPRETWLGESGWEIKGWRWQPWWGRTRTQQCGNRAHCCNGDKEEARTALGPEQETSVSWAS